MKLCPHVIDGSADATRIVLEGKAPAVKLIGGYDHAADYKVNNPNVFVWARYVPGSDSLWRTMGPDQFYDTYIRPQVIHPANQSVDAWETGLNEDFRKVDGTETPDYGDMANRGTYEAVIAARIYADGKRPVLGQFSVGTPSGTYDQQKVAWRYYREGILAAQRYNGFISLHTYANIAGWDGPVRSLIDVMGELTVNVPLLVSECGNEPGWRSVLAADVYANQLIAFDNLITTNYPQIKAAAIFSSGNTTGSWVTYNIDDPVITQALINHGKATPPMTERAMGFDISHYQGSVNFTKAKQAGITFAFIKCTEGTNVDTTFVTNWNGAKSQGILRGAYHFFRFSVDPVAQAVAFSNYIKTDLGELRPVADVEDTSAGSTVSPNNLLIFLQKVEQLTGRRPMIYTAAWYWNNTRFGGPVAWARDYDLWVANYSLTAPTPYLPTDWTTWKFWQYTASGNGPTYGVSSPAIDLDRFNGTYDALVAYSQNITGPENHPIVIESAIPTLPFSFFCKGQVPLYTQSGGVFTYSRTLPVNWKIDTSVEMTAVDGKVYWKVTNTEWMPRLKLTA